jgi:prevent-host-death family protein
MTRTVTAAEFARTCLALMDEVERTGASIVITKRGKPVARLVPAAEQRPQAFGCLRGAIMIVDEDFSLPAWTLRAP